MRWMIIQKKIGLESTITDKPPTYFNIKKKKLFIEKRTKTRNQNGQQRKGSTFPSLGVK